MSDQLCKSTAYEGGGDSVESSYLHFVLQK